METAIPSNTPSTAASTAASAMRTLELVCEAQEVLHEMNTDLTLAEAKLALTRELLVRRRERASIGV